MDIVQVIVIRYVVVVIIEYKGVKWFFKEIMGYNIVMEYEWVKDIRYIEYSIII